MNKKDKLAPLRNRLKELSDDELAVRRLYLTERIAKDNREIGAINNEIKGRGK